LATFAVGFLCRQQFLMKNLLSLKTRKTRTWRQGRPTWSIS